MTEQGIHHMRMLLLGFLAAASPTAAAVPLAQVEARAEAVDRMTRADGKP